MTAFRSNHPPAMSWLLVWDLCSVESPLEEAAAEACAQDWFDHLLCHSHIVVGLGLLQIGEVEEVTWTKVACFLV